MSSELHVYQLQLDYLRSTEYDITASLRTYVLVRARARARVAANCVTRYVSLAKLDCLKSSKRGSCSLPPSLPLPSCRLHVGGTLPIPRRAIFSSFRSSYAAPHRPLSFSRLALSSSPASSFCSVLVRTARNTRAKIASKVPSRTRLVCS